MVGVAYQPRVTPVKEWRPTNSAYYYPNYSKYRNWQILRHENGRDTIVLEFLYPNVNDGRWPADMAMKFNLHPEKAPR